MDTGADRDITNILTEAMNDTDVPDLFVDEHRALLLRVRADCDERWTTMTTNLMIQDKQNHDFIYEFYLYASETLHDELHDIHLTNCEVADSYYFEPTTNATGDQIGIRGSFSSWSNS